MMRRGILASDAQRNRRGLARLARRDKRAAARAAA